MSYSRFCYYVEGCILNECRENNWECKIDCCNINMCNVSIIMFLYVLFIGVFLCFVLEVIFVF